MGSCTCQFASPPLMSTPTSIKLTNASRTGRCFAAFPIEFEQERGWNQFLGSLPFIATLIGCIIGAAANVYNTRFYIRKFEANNYRPVPEARLPPMMVGGILFAGGLFIFGWTSKKEITWVASVDPARTTILHFLVLTNNRRPCIGAVLIGAGFLMIFQASLNYIIDTFQLYAASGVAAVTSLRSIFAAVFPLFAPPSMFHNT